MVVIHVSILPLLLLTKGVEPFQTSRTIKVHRHYLSRWSFASDLQSLKSKSSKNSVWGIGDDWQKLSDDDSYVDSSSIFNVDTASKAANDLEQFMNSIGDKDEMQQQDDIFFSEYFHDYHDLNANTADIPDIADAADNAKASLEEEDAFTQSVIDKIQTESLDPDGPALYDLHGHNPFKQRSSTQDTSSTLSFSSDDLGQDQEIALLVRCNERPNSLLVDGGRALPTLSDEEKYDVYQLVCKILKSDSLGQDSSDEQSFYFEPTDFFRESVTKIFNVHAKVIKVEGGRNIKVLGYAQIASWLSKSLGESVGQHDKRISVVMSKYATYGSGILTEEQFMTLYLDAVMIGLDDANKMKEVKTSNFMNKMKMKVSDVMSVWRDFKNHGILPPIVTVHEELQAKIDAEYGTYDFLNMDAMDECEILEWKHNESSPRRSKSSHEKVELTRDRQTTKRIRDGEFGKFNFHLRYHIGLILESFR